MSEIDQNTTTIDKHRNTKKLTRDQYFANLEPSLVKKDIRESD